MINVSNVKHDYDKELFEVSDLVVKSIRDETEEGEIFYELELQFQIENIASFGIKNFEMSVNYYNSEGSCLGSDDDIFVEFLKAGEKKTSSLFMEAPEGEDVESAELIIKGERASFVDMPISTGGWCLLVGVIALLCWQYL
ncbi:MAG: hypothetical protein COA42_22660 [Alteromonadaceae bacterium]|nr:MAG: hypothetical protein COA42_22660 [Alteromonadaceae bacterium]